MQEDTLVAQRLVCDYVTRHGGVTKVTLVTLTKELLSSVASARTSLTNHSDRITHFEQEITGLRSKLTCVTEENVALKVSVEDLVSRFKRQNIRVLGLPEDTEGRDARQFMSKLLTKVLGDSLHTSPKLDREHRSLRPKPWQGAYPHPVIVRFHRYTEKETVLKWARATKEIIYRGHRLKFY
ncbi:hypothetical protein DNTS_020993 [Danionella cerebrum]|uniref:L1 transposable element RRM domain-containing protein n=1 Tax=Danionella cerebrum TaxID=2873325 RepID=A0A553NA95_9TELE|nr:hypothetical protein DNTS_020993 [Danionella translucida]